MKQLGFMLTCAFVAQTASAAVGPSVTQRCGAFLTRQMERAVDKTFTYSQTLFPVLSGPARTAVYRSLDTVMTPLVADWRLLYNERAIQRYSEEQLADGRMPDDANKRELIWQAERLLRRERPDLLANVEIEVVLLTERPIGLYVGQEREPRRFTGPAILIVDDASPSGWFEKVSAHRYDRWNEVTGGTNELFSHRR